MKKLLSSLALLLLISPQLALAAACTSLTDHVAGSYSLDGNSNDGSGNGNNGVDTSISYSTTNAVVSQAAQFGGASKIKMASASSFTSPTTGLSLTAWVYNTANWTGIQTIVTKIDGVGNPGTYVRLNVESGVTHGSSDGDQHTIIGGTTLSLNTKYFLALTCDGATESLYVNGVKDTADIACSTVTPGTASVAIGELGDFNTVQFFAGGAIDIVGYRTCGLTQAQITSLYNSGAGLQYPFTVANPAKFTGFWHIF